MIPCLYYPHWALYRRAVHVLCLRFVRLFHGYFFFFSSRRRHTRSDRDWSSDVCSSDLGPETTKVIKAGKLTFVVSGPRSAYDAAAPYLDMMGQGSSYVGEGELSRIVKRSEGRRVGEECRSRWAPDH